MKEKLFVTFADKNYINQAKQLFASVYFNSGWKGDYMLLSYKIPKKEIKWFTKKGIIVKECKPLSKKIEKRYPCSILHAMRLFTSEFKKWKKIIFIEGDVIVKASISNLAEVEGFTAVPEICFGDIESQFYKPSLLESFYTPWTKKEIEKNYDSVFKKLKEEYDIKSRAFNFGVMAFDRKIIREDNLKKIINLVEKYGEISSYGPQGITNLLFYKKWKPLPIIYNTYINFWKEMYEIKPEKVRGIILHFATWNSKEKPWHPKNPFYREWLENLKKAEYIDLSNIPRGNHWTKKEIKKYCKKIERRAIIKRTKEKIDSTLGKIGEPIKKRSLFLYKILKKFEKPFQPLYIVRKK